VPEGDWCQKAAKGAQQNLLVQMDLTQVLSLLSRSKGARLKIQFCKDGYWRKKRSRDCMLAWTGGEYFVNRVFTFD